MDNVTRSVLLSQAIVSLDAARRLLAELEREGTQDPAAWKCALEHASDQVGTASMLTGALLVDAAAELRGHGPDVPPPGG